ncbi:MAG: hypothetical protein ACI9DG_000099 [Oleispira sp.]|jgi:hypothetical protein
MLFLISFAFQHYIYRRKYLLLNDENFIGKIVVDLLSAIKNELEDSEGSYMDFLDNVQ